MRPSHTCFLCLCVIKASTMNQELRRSQLGNMSYGAAWIRFARRRRRRRRTPRVFVPATSSESNDNKTIQYTRGYQLICRGCIDTEDNAPRDVLIAPERNGLHWTFALAVHLFRYLHMFFRRMPPCRHGRHRIVSWRINFRCEICNYQTQSLSRFVQHIMLSPTNHSIGIPEGVNVFNHRIQGKGRAGNAFGDASESDDDFVYDPNN